MTGDFLTPEETEALIAKQYTEKEFQEQVVEMAVNLHWLVYHTFDSRRSESGFPDLTMTNGKRLIFAELKREGEDPKYDQQVWLDTLTKTRMTSGERWLPEVYVWRPSNLDDIEQILK